MSLLSHVKPTRRGAPARLLVHGANGCGKSSFGAAAPSPVFIATEDGLSNIDAVSLPEPSTWLEVLSQIDALVTEPHEYRSLVVDSLDFLEPLCWAHVCKEGKKKDIEAFGYGRGYGAALAEWRIFLDRLRRVHQRGMHIILIAHSVRRVVKNPEGEDYEAWQIKLKENAAGLIKEWVDVVGFASHEVVTTETNGRVKGLATGRRVLKTQPNAGFDAKTRYHLPKILPLDWAAFEEAVRRGSMSPVDQLTATLDAKLAELGDREVEDKARSFLAERGKSVSSLSDAIATVDAYLKELTEPRKAS